MTKEKEGKNKKYDLFKPAFISGLLIIIIPLIFQVLFRLINKGSPILQPLVYLEGIIVNLASVIFMLGFYFLGKKYNKRFLKVMAIIIAIFTIIVYITNIFTTGPIISQIGSMVTETINKLGINLEDSTQAQQALFLDSLFKNEILKSLILEAILLFSIYVILLSVITILFGVSLIKLKDKVKYSKIAGILEIVAGATLIILIGFVISIVAFVFELIILYRESGKKEILHS